MHMYGMPALVWAVFRRSFQENLGILTPEEPRAVMARARVRYREILRDIPPFGPDDILLTTLLNAAVLAAVCLSLSQPAGPAQVEDYYRQSMNASRVMQLRLRRQRNMPAALQLKLAQQAQRSQRASHPYTWRFVFRPGKSPDSFCALFDRCGICALYRRLGIFELVPALCAYDYEMAKHTNMIFTRSSTLAAGGQTCDNCYRRRA